MSLAMEALQQLNERLEQCKCVEEAQRLFEEQASNVFINVYGWLCRRRPLRCLVQLDGNILELRSV